MELSNAAGNFRNSHQLPSVLIYIEISRGCLHARMAMRWPPTGDTHGLLAQGRPSQLATRNCVRHAQDDGLGRQPWPHLHALTRPSQLTHSIPCVAVACGLNAVPSTFPGPKSSCRLSRLPIFPHLIDSLFVSPFLHIYLCVASVVVGSVN
jgi:hypothetical protein